MEIMKSDMEPKMEDVQRRLLEEKKDLEFTYGVHIGSDAVTAACNIVFRYFNEFKEDGEGTQENDECHLQKQAANLLQKVCLKLIADGTSREEKELDMAEYCLHRAIVDIMELRKERDSSFRSWHSYVQSELEGLMEKLDRFMQARTPKMPLLQQRRSKDVISSLKETHQQLAPSLSSVSLAPLGVLVTKLASMFPEGFKGDLTVTPFLIAEVAKPLIGVPSPLLLHYLRLPVPDLKEKLYEKCLGEKFTVLQLVNALSHPRQADRPIGSFLFMGEYDRLSRVHMVAEALAEVLYEGKNFLIKLDMSKYRSPDAVTKLLGAPSSFEQQNNVEGHLSEAVKRKPFSVIMFRNFEKAHESVTSLLVEILNCGRITHGQGEELDFTNTIIIITLKNKGFCKRCPCYELMNKSKRPMKQLVESMGGEAKHDCQFSHCLTTAEQNCPSLVNLVDDIVFVERFSFFYSSHATRVEMRDIALPKGVILYPSEAALKRFWQKKFTTGESQIDEVVAPMIQDMHVGNKPSNTDIMYLDIMLRSGQLSHRLADYETLIVDPLYKQFDESLKEFRALYRKEKQTVQNIYLLMLKISQLISTQVASGFSDLAKEVKGLIDNLDDYDDALSSSDEPVCKVEPSCLPEEATMDKGRLNKRVKGGLDNLLMTLSEKPLQPHVATDVIEKALLQLIINKSENLSLCRPKSYLLLGLHRHGKAHLADYLGKNLVTGDGVTLVVDIDLSDFSDDTTLLRLKNELARSIGNVQQPGSSQVVGDMKLRPCNSSQVVGDMKLRPCNIFLLNHVEKAHISVFSALLSALDVGMCRDSDGNMIDFRDTVIMLTSELGNNKIITRLFEAHEHQEPNPLQSNGDFRSELLNCVDEILFFNPVVSVQNRVARLQMRDAPELQSRLPTIPKFVLGLFKVENDHCFKRESCDEYADMLRCYISYVTEEERTFKILIKPSGELGRRYLGDGMSLEVSSGDTVESLKAELQERAGIDVDEQCLAIQYLPLVDGLKLNDYNIYRECCISLETVY